MSLNADRHHRKNRRRRKELFRRFVKTRCPKCGAGLVFPGIQRKKNANGSADCNNCGALLLVKGGRAYDFHEYMNRQDKRWPKDGKGTAYVEF